MQTNRLAQETSPYLLQHQHNPVDWYAWGPEAFEAARAQDKPIFLSVGYSTCYWCHVMERQCFENEAIAAEMNKRFINIKVDREERPDVDQLYMLAVQVLTRHGGWPMSVFLTPDLRPFYGGTYFPPTDMHGRPGFVSVLRGLEDAYRNRPGDVTQTAEQLVRIIGDLSQPAKPSDPMRIDERFIDSLIERSTDDFEPTFGGFGQAPKFPRQTLLELLLIHQRTNPNLQRLRMIRQTLDAMANGGIRDQLGGGFHRYSTDAQWLVPHFEIMLYDNAMLGWCYVEAYRQTQEERYAQIARELFDFVLREMTSPDGAFYTAFDAEVDAQEGLSYLWTEAEIVELLGADDAAIFNRVYGVDRGPNFADPHHGTGAPDKSILYLAHPAEMNDPRLAAMRQKLKAHRDGRKQPLLDTKIITSWNALMIRALAHGGRVLKEQRHVDAAARAAEFLLQNHREPGGLFRTSRGGVKKYRGFLDDYAFLTQALLALHQATGEVRWKKEAAALASVMVDLFGDLEHGGFFFAEKIASDMIIRQKTASDSPLPSGNAVAAMALLELGNNDETRRVIEAFAGQMQRGGEAMSSMVQAALEYVSRNGAVDVAAAASAAEQTASPVQIAASVVAMKAKWDSPTRLEVQVSILDGFHIQSHDAPTNLIATTLAVDTPDAEIEYPPPEMHRFAFADEPLAVYREQATITVRFRQPSAAGRIALRLTYQACDDSSCLPAITKRLEVAVQ